jgi:hypothetical protein
VILLSGMISNSSVLANAYRIFDEKVEKCIPCEMKDVVPGGKGKAAIKKKPVKRAAGKKR